MHQKQEIFLLPLPSNTSSHKPRELQPLTKTPTENKDKMCPGDGRTRGHSHPRQQMMPAESLALCTCQHALKFPSVVLSLHKSLIGPFTTY